MLRETNTKQVGTFSLPLFSSVNLTRRSRDSRGTVRECFRLVVFLRLVAIVAMVCGTKFVLCIASGPRGWASVETFFRQFACVLCWAPDYTPVPFPP